MFGKQDVCFTCSQPIKDKLYEYERYKNVYNLSRTDAADKTQFHNICCRTTAFGQSGVEERVKAAGTVTTVDNQMVVSGETNYPTRHVTRVRGEGPFAHDDVQLSKKHGKKMTFAVFGGTKPTITSVPTRRAYGNKPSAPITTARMSNRPVVGDLSTYPNGVWTLSDKKTFPKQEEMEEIFSNNNVVLHIICPMLSNEVMIETEIPGPSSVDVALTALETLVRTQKSHLGEMLSKNNVVKAPKRLLELLKILQTGKYLSLVDFSESSMVVSKVYRDIKKKVYVFELNHLKKIRVRKTLQEDQLNVLEMPAISKVSGVAGEEITIKLGDAEIVFSQFNLYTISSVTTDPRKIPIGAVLQGVYHEAENFMMSFLDDGAIYVMVIVGAFELKNVKRMRLAPDAKRIALLNMLDSL
jgi:DNA-directed RNA polymerase subunit N (RpoN/RPB10)